MTTIHQEELSFILIPMEKGFNLQHIIHPHLQGQQLYAGMGHIVLVKVVEELALIMVVLQNG